MLSVCFFLNQNLFPLNFFIDLNVFLSCLIEEMGDQLLKIFGVAEAVHSLPVENRIMVQELCGFLRKVVDHEDKNKMDIKNVAIAFGPSFFQPNSNSFDLKTTGSFCEVVILLVENYGDIFCGGGDSKPGEDESLRYGSPVSPSSPCRQFKKYRAQSPKPLGGLGRELIAVEDDDASLEKDSLSL
jgi:hypothetical protein